MSQQDVTTMRQGYEAFARGDVPAVLQLFDEQIEWREPGGGNAPRGTFRGPQSVGQDVFGAIPQHFEEFAVQPEQFIDAGEHVVVIGRFRGRGKQGQTLDSPFVHVWRMRNGKAAEFQNFMDVNAWARGWGS